MSTQEPPTARRRPPHWLLVTLAIVGSLQLIYLTLVEVDRMVVHRREVARLSSEVHALEAERVALDEIAQHAHDDVFREQLARKQGFIYPDELKVITQLPRSGSP